MSAQSLGEKIKAVRIQRQMTQNDVAGDFITRNMLSQIENGSANPSIKTIEYLAKTLKKPISYFMDDTAEGPYAPLSDAEYPDLSKSLDLLSGGDFQGVLDMLNPDDMDITQLNNKEEIIYVLYKVYLGKADRSLSENNTPEAEAFLSKALDLLKLSGFCHVAESADLLLRIRDIRSTEGVDASAATGKFAENTFRGIRELYRRISLDDIQKKYLQGNIDEALSMLGHMDFSAASPETTGRMALVKAELLAEESKSAPDNDEILRLLDIAENNISPGGKSIFLRRLYKMKARALSARGDFESAYHYLEKSETF